MGSGFGCLTPQSFVLHEGKTSPITLGIAIFCYFDSVAKYSIPLCRGIIQVLLLCERRAESGNLESGERWKTRNRKNYF